MKNKNINKIVLLNISSTFLIQGISFLTIPIFTRLLGTSQFGLYSVFHSWTTLFVCFFGLGVSNSIGNGLYQFKSKYIDFRNSLLFFGTIISISIVFVGILATPFLISLLGYNAELIWLLLIISFSKFIIGFIQGACVYEKRAELNFFISIIISLGTVTLSLILILFSDESKRFYGKIIGECIVYIIISLIVWLKFFLEKPIGIKKAYCKFGLSIGFPVIFHTLAHNILTQSDRVMMQNMNISNSEIGIYSFFYTFTSVVITILTALNTSWCPFYYDDLHNNNWMHINKRGNNYIELFTVIECGFILLSREVSYFLVDKEYWTGINIIPILIISIYFIFMYQFQVNFEFFHKKTRIIALGSAITALMNIILNILLIPKYGMYGASVATGISYLLLFIMHYFIVKYMNKPDGGKFGFKKFTFSLFCIFITGILFYVLKDFWYIRWGIGGLLGIFELKKVIKRKSIF